MKISGVRAEPLQPLRRAATAEASPTTEPAALDDTRFLGVPETELTPAVRGALAMLVVELEDLRAEVRRLKARLMEAEAAADEDPLTGVKNRRGFLRELKRIAGFVERYDTPASVIYFDLDDLKGINDRYGHAAGDAVLAEVARRLSEHVRESDVVGRMGGDEFAVALAQADLESARAKAQALGWLISGETVRVGEIEVAATASWGVRQIDSAIEVEALLADADAAMFAMKRARD